MEPVRVIKGTGSRLTRVEHGLAYDAARDEIFSSAPLASAVVVFRGDANGETAPLRVIQGPKTQIHAPWQVAVDDVHHELAVADFVAGGILIFPIDANGDTAPLRIIRGSKTGMFGPTGVSFDPERNLIVAMSVIRSMAGGHTNSGIFTFHRTDNGDVEPLRKIIGAKTGIMFGWHVVTYGGKIYSSSMNINYLPPYQSSGYATRKGCEGPPPPMLVANDYLGFVGIWNETDNGDVPPRAVIWGAASGLVAPGGIAINPKAGELYVTEDLTNSLLTFRVPGFFPSGS
jgi:hypothetical protein